jgi:hypothetical protein
MNGIVLGSVMLVHFAGAHPAVETPGATIAPAPLTVGLPRDATPALELPRDLLPDEPRPAWQPELSRRAQATTVKRSSTTKRVIGVATGAFGGFMAGGMIGYAVTQRRDVYDDGVSGLKGAVIGAPIGAVVGAVIGYRLTK